MTISAVIITYNEEDYIASCIESIVDVADEIVVVDSYSEDNTKSICEKKGVRFIQHEFEGHVQQKNYAMSQAEHEYILSLDADERLSDELTESILDIKDAIDPAEGYRFNRRNNFCGQWIKHGGWYPDKKIRLWNRERGRWGGNNPHDRVVMQSGSRVEHLSGDLLHYTYGSIDKHIEQIHKFSSISAGELVKSNKRTSIIKIIASPIFKFIRDYIIKAGFLDGYYGFVIAANSAWAKYLKYLKAYELKRKARDDSKYG